MTDITDGVAPNGAFAEAAREAEALARAADGETVEGQPRDEAGKFVAVEPEADAVVEPEPEPVAPEPTAADTLLAGKYKSVEELERGYLEAKAFADRQGNELGELRSAFEQQFAQINERLDTPATPTRQITPDMIDRDPAYATQVAYEQGDTQTAAIAFEQWKIEDPGGAISWRTDKLLEEKTQDLEQKFAANVKKLEDQFAPIRQRQDQAILRDSVAALPEATKAFLTTDDGAQVAALASEYPRLHHDIVNGTPIEKIDAIKTLYDIHRGRTADTLTHAATDVARTVAQEAQAVRDEAYVASTTSSEAETMTWEQQEQARAVQAFTSKASLWDEALVRPGKN